MLTSVSEAAAPLKDAPQARRSRGLTILDRSSRLGQRLGIGSMAHHAPSRKTVYRNGATPDARWTVKFSKAKPAKDGAKRVDIAVPSFGYKTHIGIDRRHWVLDTTFDEDRARTRKDHGPANLAVLRKLALNVLRTARPKLSIKRKQRRSGWSDAFAQSIIGQMR